MTTIVAHAPGKLFLTGDWAVLAGAPAVVAAVDRRATVRVTPSDDAALEVESGADGRRRRFTASDTAALDGDGGAVVAAWRTVGGAGARVAVESAGFLIGERKLGLGRSAAVLTAAVAAFRRLAGAAVDPGAMRTAALDANAHFQSGRGSGGDIAAALEGGVVEVRRAADGLQVARRALPDGLHLVAGWTGDSAHTTPLLARFDAATAAHAGLPAELKDLCTTAEAAADAVARGHAADLCTAVDRSADALARLGARLDMPIYTPALDRLVAAARRAGAAAKPSGAGGGDCGIALATSAAQAAAVRAAWQADGIVPLAITIAATGVTVDH